MDRKTENFILNLLQEIKSECAIFFISHRLQALKNISDMIYILEEGIVKEFGNHEKLMQTENFYSEFWK